MCDDAFENTHYIFFFQVIYAFAKVAAQKKPTGKPSRLRSFLNLLLIIHYCLVSCRQAAIKS